MYDLPEDPRRDIVEVDTEFAQSLCKTLSRAGLIEETTDPGKTDYREIRDVLDLGTGKGNLVIALNEAGMKAVGIDVRDFFRKAENNHSRFSIAEAKQLPFPNESFDLVCERYLFSDIHELQKHPLPFSEVERIIVESKRILRPGGYFISIADVFNCSNVFLAHGFEKPYTPIFIPTYQKPQEE